MKKTTIISFASFALFSLSTFARAAETISGIPTVVNGTTIMVSGKTIQLYGIKGPKGYVACTWKSKRTMNCAKLATAGLKDITIASTVICRRQNNKTYVCKADGFDLAYGLIHAGWALPTANAPKSYFAKRDNARTNKRGLWRAVNKSGQIVALQIQ